MNQVKKRENREGCPRQRSLSKSLGWEGADDLRTSGRWVVQEVREKSGCWGGLGNSERVSRTESKEFGGAFAVPA